MCLLTGCLGKKLNVGSPNDEGKEGEGRGLRWRRGGEPH